MENQNEAPDPSIVLPVCVDCQPHKRRTPNVDEGLVDPASNLKDDLYKTELCHHFMEFGFCKYGSRCCFAHSEAELRPKPKTYQKHDKIPCMAYHNEGYCPYGERCRFQHSPKSPKVFLTFLQHVKVSDDGDEIITSEEVFIEDMGSVNPEA
ncbi:hypothetical protein J8273_7438 [Carpediemonas membranifera]|uniref:C3H1-type domain-containing protein n=1 Tax=Carpediemonas membranifera TaxID=201153 RepID=A0A8J6DXX4_9EUKA|nr:hypothetical protein J8273_7438 [Carpediemonas membranifera]|eukprot:KAG9391164.1 hypothetical protein J8273_7438 [Carpediemonas membranifera]